MKIRIGKIVEYNISKLFPGTIIVNKILPDKSKEPIGFITQEIDEGGDLIIYSCRDAQGKKIGVAADSLTAQNLFEKYAMQLNVMYPHEFEDSNGKENAGREGEIKNVRQVKGRKNKGIGISK